MSSRVQAIPRPVLLLVIFPPLLIYLFYKIPERTGSHAVEAANPQCRAATMHALRIPLCPRDKIIIKSSSIIHTHNKGFSPASKRVQELQLKHRRSHIITRVYIVVYLWQWSQELARALRGDNHYYIATSLAMYIGKRALDAPITVVSVVVVVFELGTGAARSAAAAAVGRLRGGASGPSDRRRVPAQSGLRRRGAALALRARLLRLPGLLRALQRHPMLGVQAVGQGLPRRRAVHAESGKQHLSRERVSLPARLSRVSRPHVLASGQTGPDLLQQQALPALGQRHALRLSAARSVRPVSVHGADAPGRRRLSARRAGEARGAHGLATGPQRQRQRGRLRRQAQLQSHAPVGRRRCWCSVVLVEKRDDAAVDGGTHSADADEPRDQALGAGGASAERAARGRLHRRRGGKHGARSVDADFNSSRTPAIGHQDRSARRGRRPQSVARVPRPGLLPRSRVQARRPELALPRRRVRLRFEGQQRHLVQRAQDRLRPGHVPVSRHRPVHQLVLRLRRQAALPRRQRRGVSAGPGPLQVSRAGVQVSLERQVRLEGGPLRRRQGLPEQRGRAGLRRSEKYDARRARSAATTASACRPTSSATRWSPAGTGATSRARPVARATVAACRPTDSARSDAPTGAAAPTPSPAAARTAAATTPTRYIATFAQINQY
ncbi:unnamed protein product [Trichogramma brassicae]|uniref:Uncharacterized protein n=1 Tax=Trichogramma brassicae TaxID=86971 RepID=A0A6H5INS2_9HYME|nr:unnamed protein product [Trichogramma brassicae]